MLRSQGLDTWETRTWEQGGCYFTFYQYQWPEAAGTVAHISGKRYGGISRGWRELEAKSEEKFKSWVTLKVMKKISAWVFQNWTSVSGFTEGLGKEGTQCNI